MVLETSQERVKLLKAGFVDKEIEKIYIEQNGFEIVKVNWCIDLGEILGKLRQLLVG